MRRLLSSLSLAGGLVAGAYACASAQAMPSSPVQPQGPLIAPAPEALPAATQASTLDLELGGSYESLTNNRGTWNSQYLLFTRRTDSSHVFYGQFQNANRFGKNDQQIAIGDFFPLGGTFSGYAEGDYSPTHNVLPAFSGVAGIQYGSGSGWYEGLAYRNTDYASQSVNAGLFTLETYWKNFRAYYALTAAQLNGTGTDVEHTVELDTYYGSNGSNSVGISYTTGREVENIGTPTLLTSHVDDYTILGRHWLGAHTALHYQLWISVQGNSYTRTGGSIGLDVRF